VAGVPSGLGLTPPHKKRVVSLVILWLISKIVTLLPTPYHLTTTITKPDEQKLRGFKLI
jgi:uncharacterized protein involved in response to NO